MQVSPCTRTIGVSNTQSGITTTAPRTSGCTEKYGKMRMGPSRPSIISITRTAIQKTMTSRIWNALMGQNIFPSIKKGIHAILLPGWQPFGNGSKARKAKSVFQNLAIKISIISGSIKSSVASSAILFMSPRTKGETDFAAAHANPSLRIMQRNTQSKNYVDGAGSSSSLINLNRVNIVGAHAGGKAGSPPPQGGRTLRVLRVESAGRSDAYCMSVENTEAFALGNGAIAHNCRYALMMRRYAVRVGDAGIVSPKPIMPRPIGSFGAVNSHTGGSHGIRVRS